MAVETGQRRQRRLVPPRAAVPLAVALWLVFGVVVWNVVFDAAVVVAGRQYVYRQAEFIRGRGPEVSIPGVMRPAIRRGAREATLWGGLVAAGGLAAVAFARRAR